MSNSEMVKHFTIEAALDRQTITASVRSDTIDEMVTHWGELLKVDTPRERRSSTMDVVVTSLMKGTHHTNPGEARAIVSALVWLAATGPMGEGLLDLMRGGDVTIGYEISQLREGAFNFRLRGDEKCRAALQRGPEVA